MNYIAMLEGLRYPHPFYGERGSRMCDILITNVVGPNMAAVLEPHQEKCFLAQSSKESISLMRQLYW